MSVLEVIRVVVFGVFVASGAVAVGSWALRARRISPFGKTAQLIRRTTDPVLLPIERWLHRRGGNPQKAGWWLLGGAVVGGIVVVTLAQWLAVQLTFISQAGSFGPLALFQLAVYYGGQLVTLAILVRVIGSWIGQYRGSPFMRPFYFLTDWIVEPLRRVVPRFGMIDISPIVAFFLIQIFVSIVMGL